MDTKLKNNKKIKRPNLLILLLCIVMLPIFIGISYNFIICQGDTNTEKFLVDVMNDVCLSANDMNYYINQSDGSLKEEAIQNQITYLKNTDKNILKDVTNQIKSFMFDSGENDNSQEDYEEKRISLEHNEYYNGLLDRKNELEEKLKQGDQAYREDGIKEIQNHLDDKYANLAKNPNIEYYIEKNDNEESITNIKGESKDEIISDTKSNYKYYMMFLEINHKVPEEINVSNSLKESLHETYNLYNNKQVIVRISNPLKSGDEICNKINEKNKYSFIGYIFSVLTLLDIFIIIILTLKCKKELYIILKDNFIIRCYKKLFIEIRCLFILAIIIYFDEFKHMIGYLFCGKCYFRIDFWTTFLMVIILVYLVYLVIADIKSLFLLNKEINIRDYLCKKSILYKSKDLMKESFLIKSTSSRLIISIIGFIVYVILILIEGYSIGYDWWWPYNIFALIPAILGTAFIIIYLFSVARNINRIKIGTDNILKGNYNNKIDVKGAIILKDIANNIVNIEKGLDKAVDKAVKSEKMKGELITNVSHDLKTPLTSIINYIDLLDRKNISEDDKKKYLDILKERSLRLKVLIEDLFEASKASSGTLELNMEKLDPVALIRQTIGEFEDKIEKANLYFIKNIPESKLTIYADGKKSFRVFQNLISNILKYSMKGSRVYIEVFEVDGYIEIIFKNISEYQLNFTEEEILERFKRGDSSRTTEGSGLGLSIAKSLVELQGGKFDLNVDGDLFKVSVKLKKA
ncbi:histidine kinase dimerization/phospho-acceptor domain-containing protein [Clostridium uliginosum]|uniref:histidine kinase n=1 Tax=Clostridium uliginosum TaxID=119641 RepID=A0A1I1HM51_9CLOT|nr:histidine kinase dimerization/phospho-acceptor domain-containing protein [Clostridium uliginosum]SFC22130.1 Signal transduction histidine kinase [Clostridium uliginosum]